MARKLEPHEIPQAFTSLAKWSDWADGEAWEVDCMTDLTRPSDPTKAANAARHWARTNGYNASIQRGGPDKLILKFTPATTRTLVVKEFGGGSPEFREFLSEHYMWTGEASDRVRLKDVWEAWDNYRKINYPAATVQKSCEPLGARLMRPAIESYLSDEGIETSGITPVGGKLAYLLGARVKTDAERRTADAAFFATAVDEQTVIAEHNAAVIEQNRAPEPRPAMPSVKLPPSPFGSNQPEKAPPSPTAPKLTIDWPTLNALATTIDQLDDNEQDTTP